jgi:hypothetical protein
VTRSGGVTRRGLILLAVALVGLAIVAFVLAHLGGGHGIARL